VAAIAGATAAAGGIAAKIARSGDNENPAAATTAPSATIGSPGNPAIGPALVIPKSRALADFSLHNRLAPPRSQAAPRIEAWRAAAKPESITNRTGFVGRLFPLPRAASGRGSLGRLTIAPGSSPHVPAGRLGCLIEGITLHQGRLGSLRIGIGGMAGQARGPGAAMRPHRVAARGR